MSKFESQKTPNDGHLMPSGLFVLAERTGREEASIAIARRRNASTDTINQLSMFRERWILSAMIEYPEEYALLQGQFHAVVGQVVSKVLYG